MSLPSIQGIDLSQISLPEGIFREESDHEIPNIVSEILGAIHGEVKIDFKVSFDLPKVAEIIKTQLLATGEKTDLLWALVAIEKDPSKTVARLCDLVEEFSLFEMGALYALGQRAPKLELSLIDALVKVAQSGEMARDNLGDFALYLLQRDYKAQAGLVINQLERLAQMVKGSKREYGDDWFGEGIVEDLASSVQKMIVLSAVFDRVRPLSDLDKALCSRLGKIMIELSADATMVDPENHLIANLLQGKRVDEVAKSFSDPLYQALTYDFAAFTYSLSHPALAEAFLAQAIEIAGEGEHEVTHRTEAWVFSSTSSMSGPSTSLIRGLIGAGFALKNPKLGVSKLLELIAQVGDEDFEQLGLSSLIGDGLLPFKG